MSGRVTPHIYVAERRTSERATTLLMGFVHSASNVAVPCCIKNVSDTGVMLEFPGNTLFVLSPKFEFSLDGTGQRYPVKLVWRKGRQIGVVFC